MARSSKAFCVLHDRLRSRRSELEHATLIRVYGISDPTDVVDQTYINGLRQAVTTGLDFGIAAIENGPERRDPQIPPELLVQTRLAARNGVSLDTVLRRCCGGNTMLSDILIEESERIGLPRSELKRLLRALAANFDRLLASVSEEYSREANARPETGEERRTVLVERLLAGELLDASELSYDLDGWHLGLLIAGPDPADALRELAFTLDRRLLSVRRDVTLTWVWLGGRHPFDSERVSALTSYPWPLQIRVGIGEPAEGIAGWRLTHRQAAVTLPIALRGKARIVHHAEAPLLASALQDLLLATTLRQLYLAPLEAERDGGATAKVTLRAYFAAGGNASSAAAALGVNRSTVASRLAAIEERIGRPIDGASAEIETALRLDEIEAY